MAKKKGLNKVYILERKTSEMKISLYLYWSIEGKKTKEALGIKIFIKPSSVLERQHNKESWAKAEMLRTLRESQIFKGEIEEVLEAKDFKNVEFLPYFENYVKYYTQKDLRVMKAVLNQFKDFAPKGLLAKDLSEEFCLKFREYLDANLSGETPQSYFARFKKVLRYATKYGKLFKYNPAYDIVNASTKDSIAKEVLEIEEVKALANTHCGNEMVKRAFLFACFTGLRYVDISNLRWSNIRGDKLSFTQEKTKDKAKDGGKVEMTLHLNALELLKERGERQDLVFDLPSHTAVLKNLRIWTKRAGVDKHITFHSARHSFGTLLASNKVDINLIASLLGHTSLKHTGKYIRIADEMKKKAVDSIPNIY